MANPILIGLIALLLIPVAVADDEFKPYLHNPTVPEAPKVSLYGKYQTNLFPGAGTYTYDIEVSPGTNELQPSLSLSFNSQAMKQRSSIVGAGWQLTQNLIFRDANFTPTNQNDDFFVLVLNGATHELKYDSSDAFFHTEIETFSKIENLSGAPNQNGLHWNVILKDGTKLRFGHDNSAELMSNSGKDYSVKWFLDQVEDTHNNKIAYSYAQNPHAEDNGSVYLTSISYNNDEKRLITFSYEENVRPDRRLVFNHGDFFEESRRLEDISMHFNNTLVRRYHLNYTSLGSGEAFSSLSRIQYFGSDNSSLLHAVDFSYYTPYSGYNDSNGFTPPVDFVSGDKDQGLRVVDLNNDGLADLIRGDGTGPTKDAWLNNGSGWMEKDEFAPPEVFVSVGEDQGLRLVDVNADGFVDIIKNRNGVQNAWLNNGSGWVENSTWNPPQIFVDVTPSDRGTRLADINGDGRIDLVRNDNNEVDQKKAYLNTPEGWVDVSSEWVVPESFVGVDYSDQGVRLVDFNGDGLTDLVRGYDATLRAYLNNGSGWVETNKWIPPVAFVTSSQPDKGTRFVDLNQDGLVDIIADFANTSTTERGAWINSGSGWVQDNDWLSPEPFTSSGKNIGRRIGDVNGDGFGDIIVSESSKKKTWIRDRVFPTLLVNITNEFGGVTRINYTHSTQFNNTKEDGLSDLGFNIWVVDRVEQDNRMIGEFNIIGNTTYAYYGGAYDYEEGEFRGFSEVNETLPDNSIVKHYFLQGDGDKGKEFKTETYDAGSLLFRSENTFSTSEEIGPIFTTVLTSSASHTFDGNSVARSTNVTYTYDDYGNVIGKTSLGEVDVGGDEKYELYDFVYNLSSWIIDRVSWYRLFDSDNSTLLRETKYMYDGGEYGESPQKGDVTKIEEYLDTESSNPSVQFFYDDNGNLVKRVDPIGEFSTFDFGIRDGTKAFADRVSNDLEHITDFEYDVGTGNLLIETKNGFSTTFSYDTFGRISKEILPYDTSTFPTKSYSYDFDGVAPEIIKVSQKTTSNKTLDTHYLYDGFANLVQIKTPSSSGQVVKNILYDGLFRVKEEQNPYFASFTNSLEEFSNTTNTTTYTYDGLSRITQVENPDGTTKQTSYDKWTITDTDENGNAKVYTLDGYERIIAVTEENTDFYIGDVQKYNTTYVYNGADELVSIEDAEGNAFNFTYDAKGRKVQLDDPDLGRWVYEYDLSGNLVKQTDNKGNEVMMSYDSLNRLLHKNTSSQVITFSYDVQYDGTLANISYDNISYSFVYDERLRVVDEVLHARHHTFETGFTYDSLDRVLEKRLPDSDDLEFFYGAQGKLEKVKGFVNQTSFNPFGNPLNRSYFNTKITQFSYDSENARLSQIQTDSVQNLQYGYDFVGNVVSIDDSVNSRNYRMSYDDLDRLTNVSIGEFKWVYSFDPPGNILKIVRNFSETTSFKFNSGLAHAPSSVVTSPAGVDVYKEEVLFSNNKTKQVQFYLVNEKNSSLSDVDWRVFFGDGNSLAGIIGSLDQGGYSLITANHTYSNGGLLNINITGQSNNEDTDYSIIPFRFGAVAHSVQHIFQNVTHFISEFSIENKENNHSTNWGWNCSNGVFSSQEFTMDAGASALVVIEHDASTSDNSLICEVNSSDGESNASTSLPYKGVVIERYNSTNVDKDSVSIKFTIKNYHSTQSVKWNVTGGNMVIQNDTGISLGQNEELSVSEVLDFDEGGVKKIRVTVYSDDFVDVYRENYDINWLFVEEFMNVVKNATTRVLEFFVHNTNELEVLATWNTTDPDVSNSDDLGSNESILVVIEEEYDQGKRWPIVDVVNSTDQFRDFFYVQHIGVEYLDTLHENPTSAVVHAMVKNNVANRSISWSFNNSQEMISSSEEFSLEQDEDVFVVVENNIVNDGVYPVNFLINSSSLNHNVSGVVVS